MSAIVVNLIGGPGCRKSTMAAEIFAKLKYYSVNCELVGEYAKDKVWEKSIAVLDNQIYVFGKQHHRLFRLNTQVDVIVTDSPLLLSIIYDAEKRPTFRKLVFEEFSKFNNLNFLINRTGKYDPIGRLQTEDEAKQKDKEILDLFLDLKEKEKFDFEVVSGTKESCEYITQKVIQKLTNEQRKDK